MPYPRSIVRSNRSSCRPGVYDSYSPHWSHQQIPLTSYRTVPFAQSVYHHSLPTTSYPTPPPLGATASSSSSLANALGDFSVKSQKPRPHQNDSARFFNSFITENAINFNAPRCEPDHTVKETKVVVKDDSPDPLAVKQLSPQQSSTIPERPRKRKHIQVSNSSPAHSPRKNHPSHDSLPITSSSKPSTPSSSVFPATPTPRLKPYVEIPPLPRAYMTPVSRKRKHVEARTHQMRGSPTDDLGGYGTDSEDKSLNACLPGSSTRRTTGERDERGACLIEVMKI